jgi:hypothetical protein
VDNSGLKETSDEGTGKYEDDSYFDNIYWNMKPLEIALDEIN